MRLLGWPVSEVDIAVPMPPEETLRRLEIAAIKVVPTGLEHGTVTAIVGGHPFEITSLRRDVETDGRHAMVVFTDDWEEDAARRDFTMNALYATGDGEIFDYHGGVEDLIAGRVRFVGDPSDAHPGRLSAHSAALPLSCLVRQRRYGSASAPRGGGRQSRTGATCRASASPRNCCGCWNARIPRRPCA